MSNYAVIDCGTNTFHLLIAQAGKKGEFKEIYRERTYVKLAKEGIETIGKEAYTSALNTLKHYAQVIAKHKVVDIQISGTAALRTASNGLQLVQEIKEKTGLNINIISGRDEAKLIQKGVAQAIGPQQNRWMVMDIGGGSVEFIIVDEQGVCWFESLPIGVAIIYKHFHLSEPISVDETQHLRTFLAGQLVSLHTALLRYPTSHLVGAAGTFDVLANKLGIRQPTPNATILDLDGFKLFYHRVLAATKNERHNMSDIPDDRADMIVVALILVNYILEIANIKALTVSDFSLKEGMLEEMMAKNQ